MDKAGREQIESRLLRERGRVIRVLQRMDDNARKAKETGELTQFPLHLADHGTDAMEQEKELILMGTEGQLLKDIDEALRRLYRDGEGFGCCERCGKEIALGRLDLIPWARACIDCQKLIENGLR
jgi:RNA polymerase-binding transcription factor DksA